MSTGQIIDLKLIESVAEDPCAALSICYIDELENFTYIYNVNTRKVQYSAPSGMHDDGVMSTALAWHALKHYRMKGKYKILRA